ncbi:2229_t:CDS:10 [Ambispora leptoticha]|uniref:Vacuolar protein sorting-associated protein 27 n=1 Tax=Ambispora leptoticha TaxID=144679 RepID=A0A9N8VB73_9GLOM|nr:2229_t:CDS:10 [Ambispora leptoticha]
MVSRIWGSSPFDELVEKATSELLPKGQEDLTLNLDISDQIRSKSVPAKDAMKALKRRIDHINPNVQLLALSLTDTCVKNGGHHFLIEIASREFVDNLVSILRSNSCNSEVRSKLLSLIQTWGIAFDGKPELSYVSDTYRLLKEEFAFPKPEKAAFSVMIDTATPPEWTDSDVCIRCRTPFTTFNRKHHCRNCGQTFCGDCSSKTMALPHIGMNEPVRVCDSCHIKKQLKKTTRSASIDHTALKNTHNATHSRTTSLPNGSNGSNNTLNSRREDDDDEDFKKAIELSLKEAESSRGFASFQQKTTQKVVEQPKKQEPVKEEEEDADLAAAIAASLREMNLNQQRSNYSSSYAGYDVQSYQTPAASISHNELSAIEAENIYKFSEIVERIQQSGSDLMRDRQVQELYERIGELKPKLTKTLSETIQKHQDLVDMHEKLSQVVKLYDRLLEERLSGAYTRRASTTSYSLQQRVNPPVGTQGIGSFYPTINTIAQAPNIYPQINYPAASAPVQSPTYYPSQPLLANQQSHSNQIEQQTIYSQQYTPSKQTPHAQYSYVQQTPAPYAPVAGTANNDTIVPTNPIEYHQVNVNHQQQSINGMESYSILQGYQDAGYQQQPQPIEDVAPLIEL